MPHVLEMGKKVSDEMVGVEGMQIHECELGGLDMHTAYIEISE